MERLVRDPDVLWRQACGVLVAAGPTPADGPPIAVTGVGAAIWLALEEPRSRAELAQLAEEISEQSTDEGTDHLAALLDLLEQHRLIRRVP